MIVIKVGLQFKSFWKKLVRRELSQVTLNFLFFSHDLVVEEAVIFLYVFLLPSAFTAVSSEPFKLAGW